MKQVNIHDAKTHLSRLIEEVEAGEEIVLARAGKPVARLTGLGKPKGIEIGVLKGQFTVDGEFASPLPADLLAAFEAKPKVKAIVDTYLLLQALTDDPKLSQVAREVLTDADNEIFVSTASIWEIAVKFSLGKLSVDPQTASEAIVKSGFSRLEVEDAHLQALATLPWRHKDLFGRIIVAQSISEPMKLVTSDWRLAAYEGPVILV